MTNNNDINRLGINTHAQNNYHIIRYQKNPDLAIGDYVICVEEVDAFDGTGLPLFKKGNIYRVTNLSERTFGLGIELHTRPGCIILSTLFIKSHLQISKKAEVA